MKRTISDFNTIINNNISNKKNYFVIKYNNKHIQILNYFYNEGFIDFFIKKSNKLYIKIKQNNGRLILKKLQSTSKKGQIRTISYKSIQNLYMIKQDNILITDQGFISYKIARKIKKGGALIITTIY